STSDVSRYNFDSEDMDVSVHIEQSEQDESNNAMDFGIEQAILKQEKESIVTSSNNLSIRPKKSADLCGRKTKRSLLSTNNVPSVEDDIEIIGSKRAPLFSEEKTAHMIALGIPPLTKTEEKILCTQLTQHSQANQWSFLDAEIFAKQFACDTVRDNYNNEMQHIQQEWFYDFLLKYPLVVGKFKYWFERMKPMYPTNGNSIEIKLWHLRLIAQAPIVEH
ncbi:unnamed protein product, partial [Didymodactylos carnosus]